MVLLPWTSILCLHSVLATVTNEVSKELFHGLQKLGPLTQTFTSLANPELMALEIKHFNSFTVSPSLEQVKLFLLSWHYS